MKTKKPNFIILLLLLLTVCDTENVIFEKAGHIIAGVREEFAPDPRVALFDIEHISRDGQLVLRGESNLPKAVDSLKVALKAKDIAFIDSVQILPDEALEGKIYGVVKLSVANLRGTPGHSSELVTQATLGMPLNVLKRRRGWYFVQTPDDYLAWIDSGGLITMNKEDFDRWQTTEKLIYLKPFGFSHQKADEKSPTVSDLVSGNILEFHSETGAFYRVKYPDSTMAYVAKQEMLPYSEWLAALKPSGQTLVSTSKTLMGLPYLWGGTSFKGVDCSGFTKTVYFLNGMIIPRDASQQVHTGLLVDSTRSFDKLLPGDLLFFGRPATDSRPERIIHVGMWIGNNEFIHSAGNVHISSMDSTADNFDAYNYNRYLRTKRLLRQQDEKLIRLEGSQIFGEN